MGLIKNVIADVIKRCVMIHDNNYAAGKTTPCDLVNVRAMAKSIAGFITDNARQSRRFPAETDRNAAGSGAADNSDGAHTQKLFVCCRLLLLKTLEKTPPTDKKKNQSQRVRGGVRLADDVPAQVTNGSVGLTGLQELMATVLTPSTHKLLYQFLKYA